MRRSEQRSQIITSSNLPYIHENAGWYLKRHSRAVIREGQFQPDLDLRLKWLGGITRIDTAQGQVRGDEQRIQWLVLKFSQAGFTDMGLLLSGIAIFGRTYVDSQVQEAIKYLTSSKLGALEGPVDLITIERERTYFRITEGVPGYQTTRDGIALADSIPGTPLKLGRIQRGVNRLLQAIIR